MTTTTQQPPSNPALDFANSILEVTNNGLELIEILRDIANDCDEKATTNDRIAPPTSSPTEHLANAPSRSLRARTQPPKPTTTA